MFLPPSLTEVAVTSCLRPSMNQVIQTPRWLLPVFLPPSLRLSQRWLRDGSYLCFAVGVCVFQVHLVHHPRGCWHIADCLLPQVPHLQHGQQVSTASLVSVLDCEQTTVDMKDVLAVTVNVLMLFLLCIFLLLLVVVMMIQGYADVYLSTFS